MKNDNGIVNINLINNSGYAQMFSGQAPKSEESKYKRIHDPTQMMKHTSQSKI